MRESCHLPADFILLDSPAEMPAIDQRFHEDIHDKVAKDFEQAAPSINSKQQIRYVITKHE